MASEQPANAELSSQHGVVISHNIEHIENNKNNNDPPETLKIDGDLNFYDDTKNTGVLIMDIIDTGIGLTKEECKRLFEPFNQANSSIKAKYGGTGLGLWITKQLIYMMSGFIELKSEPNIGTRFTITLPFNIIMHENMGSPSPRNRGNKLVNSILSEPSKALKKFRENRKIFLSGQSKLLRNAKILIIEDDRNKNDLLLTQVLNQLKSSSSKAYYTTYSNVTKELEENNYNVLLLMYTSRIIHMIELASYLVENYIDEVHNKMELCVVSGTVLVKFRSS